MLKNGSPPHFKELFARFCYRCTSILILILILAGFQAKSQSEENLLELVNQNLRNRHDSIYYELFKLYRVSDTEKAKHYAQISLQIASEYKHFLIQAKAYRALGYLCDVSNQFDSATLYLHKGIRLSSLNNFTDLLINLYNDLGLLKERVDVYDSAFHYFMLSYNLASLNKSFKMQAIASSNLSLVYSYLEDYDKAIYYLKRTIALENEIGAKEGININLINLARIFNEQNLFNDALQQLRKVALNCKKGCDDNILAGLNYGYGFVNLKKGNLTESRPFFVKALIHARKDNNKKWIANTLYNLSIIAIHNKSYSDALKYLEEAETNALEIGHRRLLRDVYAQLSKLNESIGALGKAMKYEKLYTNVKDSIFSKRIANNIAKIQLSDQHKQAAVVIRKKDITISQKSEALWESYGMIALLVISFIMAIAIIYIIYQSLRTSRRNKNVMELKLIKLLDRDQINQKELFRKETEFNYLLGSVTSFLKEPVNSLIGLSGILKKNYTPEEAIDYATKIHHICTSKISGVFEIVMELSGVRKLGVFAERIEVKTIAELVHQELKNSSQLPMLNFIINKSVQRALQTDQSHLVTLIKNAIRYFTSHINITPIEISFEQNNNTTTINIKNYHQTPSVTAAKEVPHESLFSIFSAQVIASKLGGDSLLLEREGYSLFKIQIPTDYNAPINKSDKEILESAALIPL